MDHEFRSAAFGGFHKQDVLDFLEATAKQTAQQRESLEKQLEEERRRADELQDQLESAQSQIMELSRERERLEGGSLASNGSLEQAEGQLQQLKEENARLRTELEQQRQETARLKPEAEAYAAVKDRTAGIELDAHRRAQAVLDEAERQAAQLRRDTVEWLCRVEKEYDALRTQVESTAAHAVDELAKAGRALDQVTQLLGEQDVALKELEQGYTPLSWKDAQTAEQE